VQAQRTSLGISADEILEEVLRKAGPESGASWLDVGCGTGDLLRLVGERYAPARMTGVDLIDFLSVDLRPLVDLRIGQAEDVLEGLGSFQRVVLSEVIEHLDAPWSTLRAAALLVAPGGRIVVSTPNIAAFRSRLNLLARGELAAFRPDNLPHQTPALAHVIRRVLTEQGIVELTTSYAARDVLPLTGGRHWPRRAARRWPRLAHISVVIAGARPR
jgi:2-polyprenyl-3-methyl-5-hydroxy-6-metoxy-1,4-benzoquinol methylase